MIKYSGPQFQLSQPMCNLNLTMCNSKPLGLNPLICYAKGTLRERRYSTMKFSTILILLLSLTLYGYTLSEDYTWIVYKLVRFTDTI